MGGSTKTTSSNTVDPKLMDLYYRNFARNEELANQPFQAYTGQRVAPLSDAQKQAQGLIAGIANEKTGAANLSNAGAAFNALANYKTPDITSPGQMTPQTVSARQIAAQNMSSPGTLTAENISAPTVTAGLLKDTDLSAYFNPYQKSVIDTAMADLARQRDIQRVSDNQAATASRAFGGSRQGVADSLTNDAYFRNLASTTANLNSAGYANAQNAALADLNRGLEAGMFNANNQMAASQFNANANNAASQFNLNTLYDLAKTNAGYQSAADMFNATQGANADLYNANIGNEAQRYNLDQALGIQQANAANALAGANLNMNAAQGLAGLSNMELQQALSRATALGASGELDQRYNQAVNDANYEEFMRMVQDPFIKQQLLNSALTSMPIQQTNTTTQKSSPGLLDIFGAIANGVGSLGGKPLSFMG